MSANPPTSVFIAAISSDIGQSIARICRGRGWDVVGTYRDPAHLGTLREDRGISLIRCDITKPDEVDAVGRQLADKGANWDIFIAAAGQLAPIGPFFDAERAAWLHSLSLNGGGQLALLHAVHRYRRARPCARVAFLVGGAISRGGTNYSAYSLGKLTLVKFCELIHDEHPDIHAVAIGTGWVATKIHRQTLAAAERAGDNLERTRQFLAGGQPATRVEEIMACMEWCFAQDRSVTGGRNFSVVHDPWRNGGQALLAELKSDDSKFKLRRHAGSPNAVSAST